MLELEAKVWLEAKQVLPVEILKKLEQIATFQGVSKKYDTYFASKNDLNKNWLFRLRQENEQFIITYKKSLIKEGIETNEEHEFIVDNEESFINFCDYLGFTMVFKKIKHSQKFQYQDYLLELNYLEGLGHFLEIEKIIENTNNIDLALEKNNLLTVFALFGFTANDLEKRKYIQLFKEPLIN